MSVEGNAVRVAQPATKDFDSLAVLVHSQDVPLVRSVGQALAPEGRSPIRNELGNMNGVPVDSVDHSIRSEGQIVAPVPHPALGLVKDFLLLEWTVAIQITQPVQGSRVIGVGIKGSVCVKQSPAFLEGVFDRFNPFDTAGRRQAEAQQTLVLSPNGNSALQVKSHAHPGVFFLARRAEEFDLETRQGEETGGIGSSLRVRSPFPLGIVVQGINAQGRQIPPRFNGQGTERFNSLFISFLPPDLPFLVRKQGAAPARGIGPVKAESNRRSLVR